MNRIALFAVALVFASGASLASDLTANAPAATGQPAAPAAGAAPDAPKPAPVVASSDKNIKVCHMVRTIGSNMATRVCRTKAQIEADAEQARSSMSGPAGDKHF